ncbi:hypothetical protein [Tolypothrix sp. VBCCA 56010]|uniref:hypothetical protein n=1 Tax=Tolypothrix sp. VBCCA 56010 TaxID=3137731 RepID=UPI003D7D1C8C
MGRGGEGGSGGWGDKGKRRIQNLILSPPLLHSPTPPLPPSPTPPLLHSPTPPLPPSPLPLILPTPAETDLEMAETESYTRLRKQ